jgi:hypothetical protein
MNLFEYVMVLASIVVGLGITHLLQGVLDIIQDQKRRIYWVHLVWVACIFIQAVFWWWWEFRFSEVATWTFPLYLFVVGYAFLLYLICGLLFPKDLEPYGGDFKTYFYARRAWFFGALVTFTALDLLDTLLKGVQYFLSLGLEYVVATSLLIVLGIVAAIVRSERFHGAFAVALFVYQIAWALRFFFTVAESA